MRGISQVQSTIFSVRTVFFVVVILTACVVILQLGRLHLSIRGKKEAWNWKSILRKAAPKVFPWKPIKVTEVDCSKVFSGDKTELRKAVQRENGTSQDYVGMNNSEVLRLARTCDQLKRERTFINSSLTEEESNFPLAYSIMVYKAADQVLNLLSAIYRPQNVYCVHVDKKAQKSFRFAMEAIADCFPNVFLASRSVDVRWGKFSVLKPELVCMQDLWNYTHWKYFINLTGQEFPLKTNYELVKILTAYNGANDVIVDPRTWKGSVHVAVNRDFVDFVLHSPVSRDFLEWCKRTHIPDETFFPTLNRNSQLGIRGEEPWNDSIAHLNMIRYKNWGQFECAGNLYVRNICIITVGDLPFLERRSYLFANKFYSRYSRLALGCLAERLYNRTKQEYLGLLDFNATFYRELPFVQNALRNTVIF
ncbi:hypothetical protein BaRGS_00022495 [Batillaria attramentaria]|uniref:Beta-1,3-galactosyl-O-glycosyl-glycoprotein beta-1,6-N-acetylglucosaminyltransferase n=1 Tax=Batillaria attramentaria TaxID=370345 RepID=A0ABD0KH78_9CAEN